MAKKRFGQSDSNANTTKVDENTKVDEFDKTFDKVNTNEEVEGNESDDTTELDGDIKSEDSEVVETNENNGDKTEDVEDNLNGSDEDRIPNQEQSLDVLKTESLSYEEINAILENSEISQEDSVVTILEKAPTKLKMIISRLLDYQTKMSKAASIGLNDEKGKANNLNLFNTLKLVLKIEDNYEFNVTFKIVNLIFILNKEDAYSELSLCRFDAGSKKSIQLDTFGLLATTIARLAEITNRTKENINFNVLKSDTYDITSPEVEKLQHFYTI